MFFFLQAASEKDILIHMLTKDDLEQIGKLIEPLKKQLDIVVMKVEAAHQELGERIDTVETKLRKKIEKAEAEIIDTVKDTFHTTGEFHDKLKERVEKIEETLNISQN